MNPALEPAVLPTDAVEVGQVLSAWGVQGWLKIKPYSASPQALFSANRWYLQAAQTGPQSFIGTAALGIDQVRLHGASILAKIHHLSDRNSAEALRGCQIFLPRSSFPAATEDEYYWVDLIGLNVINRQGVVLGQVQQLLDTGPHSVLVLQSAEAEPSRQRMIPFVAAYIDRVSLPERCIIADWQPDY